MNTKSVTALLLALAILLGCATKYNYTDAPSTMGILYSKYAFIGYTGEIRPIEEVGIVTTDGLIKITSIDGQSASSFKSFKTSGLYSGGRYQLHLLPGPHTLVIGFYDDVGGRSRSWSTSDITKTIQISKGQVIHLSLSKDGKTWMAEESDGSSALAAIKSDFNELIGKK